ncbi:hypothetical protein O6H91_21G025400 [Diphasiastrum complanatum]|uniref:Uncharacterized protein n=2 Tax=Diphasiastrum complanatum TaxID=34168 RepID=A0ACC2AIV8_DIPCM|nr:hypothetical protein O6H91_21G025400 [Diphasiastrum complanatum]KAJ7517474.1 hypothetical protein O6H91_21G025400 [Diphasiastrum complanatum]
MSERERERERDRERASTDRKREMRGRAMAQARFLWLLRSRIHYYSTTSSSASLGNVVVIVAAKRTPIGAFQGSLAPFTACQLGSAAIKAALRDAQAEADWVEEVYMGNVLSSGLGQAPARQAALGAGLSPATICTTVNKVCASGMKAVMLGVQSIAMGLQQCVVAGGMESMSNAPFLLPRIRSTKVTGDLVMKDSMVVDGLQDAYKETSMGICAELCAEEMGISRIAMLFKAMKER